MMKVRRFIKSLAAIGLVAGMVSGPAAQAVTVTVPTSSASWNGFMNVFNLPSAGGGFVFNSAWGVPDLVATFDDPGSTLTLSPNTIGDPNQFWYQNTTGTAPDPVNPGGPGQAGNKIMEANLFIGDDTLAGQTVTFEGNVLSNTYTQAHQASVFIRDFAPDFSTFNETIAPLSTGAFSITLVTDPAPGRHVQYGLQSKGVNVWVTDTAPFGNVVIATVPEPASLGLMGLGGLMMAGRRRH